MVDRITTHDTVNKVVEHSLGATAALSRGQLASVLLELCPQGHPVERLIDVFVREAAGGICIGKPGSNAIDVAAFVRWLFEVRSAHAKSEPLTPGTRSKALAIQHANTITVTDARRVTSTRHAVPRPDLNSRIHFHEWNDAALPALGIIAHFKGFAARIDFNCRDTMDEANNTVEFMKQLNPDTLVWDGDNYEEDSFTFLIPRMYANSHPQLVMFLRNTEEERERVTSSWGLLGLPITCYLLDASLDFQELGSKALQVTRSKIVLCFGGGKVVKEEYARASGGITYVLARAGRMVVGTDSEQLGVERSALDEHLVKNSERNLVQLADPSKTLAQLDQLGRTTSSILTRNRASFC